MSGLYKAVLPGVTLLNGQSIDLQTGFTSVIKSSGPMSQGSGWIGSMAASVSTGVSNAVNAVSGAFGNMFGWLWR